MRQSVKRRLGAVLRGNREQLDRQDRENRCQWSRCKRPADIIYLGDGLCWEHWHKFAAQQSAAQTAEVAL